MLLINAIWQYVHKMTMKLLEHFAKSCDNSPPITRLRVIWNAEGILLGQQNHTNLIYCNHDHNFISQKIPWADLFIAFLINKMFHTPKYLKELENIFLIHKDNRLWRRIYKMLLISLRDTIIQMFQYHAINGCTI